MITLTPEKPLILHGIANHISIYLHSARLFTHLSIFKFVLFQDEVFFRWSMIISATKTFCGRKGIWASRENRNSDILIRIQMFLYWVMIVHDRARNISHVPFWGANEPFKLDLYTTLPILEAARVQAGPDYNKKRKTNNIAL